MSYIESYNIYTVTTYSYDVECTGDVKLQYVFLFWAKLLLKLSNILSSHMMHIAAHRILLSKLVCICNKITLTKVHIKPMWSR